MTRRKPHTLEQRQEKYEAREAKRGLAQAAEREKAEKDAAEPIPGETKPEDDC
jgi:hypothetical protein